MRMFTLLTIVTLSLCLAAPAIAGKEMMGDTKDNVIAKLGEPSEVITLGDNCDLMFYRTKHGGAVTVWYYKTCDDLVVSLGRGETLDETIPTAGFAPYYMFPAVDKLYKPKRK